MVRSKKRGPKTVNNKFRKSNRNVVIKDLYIKLERLSPMDVVTGKTNYFQCVYIYNIPVFTYIDVPF